jgi:hypothetical protein
MNIYGDVTFLHHESGLGNMYRDFAVWTMHFLMMSKRPTNAPLIHWIGA